MIFLKKEIKKKINKNGNMTLSVYSVQMVFLFPTNMILSFYQKSKDRKYGISSERKIKDYKKVYSGKYA